MQYHTFLDTLYIQGEDENAVWDEPLSAAWTVENTSEPLDFSFGENSEGKISLSPFALEVWPSTEINISWKDYAKSVQLLDKSKNVISIFSDSKFYSSSSSFVEIFLPLIELDQVQYIQIKDRGIK